MERNWNMDEVSDGKRYCSNDMVKLGCQECAGCSSCCRDMGSSIVLDPYDIYRMSSELGWSFEEMMAKCLEFNMVDGLILPNLRMVEGKNQCTFLSDEGRCRIHTARPGICRLFPLGRIYENGSFQYFLQVHECKKTSRTKMKISKWLETPRLKQYEQFISQWHYYLKTLQQQIMECQDETYIRQTNMQVLNQFFVQPYDTGEDFYTQFAHRMKEIEEKAEH